jgi:hypothetical protein
VKNGIEDPTWEVYNGDDVGWCFQASTVNQFWFFKKKGYPTLLDDAIAPPPKWLPAVSDAISDLFDYFAAPDPACQADPLLEDPINCYLGDRKTGPKQGIDGLVHQVLKQDGADVKYKSSDGGEKKFPNTKLFDLLSTYYDARDSVNLILRCPACNTWWAGTKNGNFHSVTVAGFDNLARRIWFADPDSNPDHDPGKAWPGNRNRDAGYTPLAQMVTCGVDNKLHSNQDCIRLRRFVGNEAIPVAQNNPPTQQEINQRYFTTRLKDDRMTFVAAVNGDYSRLNGATITELNVIETIKGAGKGPGKLLSGGNYVFQVSPSADGATPIDEFWLFPSSSATQFSYVDPHPMEGWDAEIKPPGIDPWGNLRANGWIYAHTDDPNAALTGTTVLEMAYNTYSLSPLPAWDLALGYLKDPANLRVQAMGVDPKQVFYQLPNSD